MAVTPGDGTVLNVFKSPSFQAVGQLVSVQPINAERGELDATDLSDAWEEVAATFKRGGEIQVTVNYDPAETIHQYVWTSFESGSARAWQIVLADAGAAVISFTAFIKSFPIETVEKENLARLVFTLRITGAVSITP